MPSCEKPASTATIMASNIYDVWFSILLVSRDESGGRAVMTVRRVEFKFLLGMPVWSGATHHVGR